MTDDTKPVLVTGATGLVGNNVIRLLLDSGRSVRVLVRNTDIDRSLVGLDIEVAHGDIRDSDSVRRAIKGAAAVVHSAGLVRIGWSNWSQYEAINVQGTRHVVDAARQAEVRMLHVSSCDTLPVQSEVEPVDEQSVGGLQTSVPYARSKRMAEDLVLGECERGLDAVVVHPAFMLGPWDWKPSSGQMLLAVVRGAGLFPPRGTFSLCDVRDVAQGIVAALEHGPSARRYIMAGVTYTYQAAWELFAEVTQARAPVWSVGPLAAFLVGRGGDILGQLTGREPVLNSAVFQLAKVHKSYSSQRAREELGYSIRPVRETIADAYDWFLQHGYLD